MSTPVKNKLKVKVSKTSCSKMAVIRTLKDENADLKVQLALMQKELDRHKKHCPVYYLPCKADNSGGCWDLVKEYMGIGLEKNDFYIDEIQDKFKKYLKDNTQYGVMTDYHQVSEPFFVPRLCKYARRSETMTSNALRSRCDYSIGAVQGEDSGRMINDVFIKYAMVWLGMKKPFKYVKKNGVQNKVYLNIQQYHYYLTGVQKIYFQPYMTASLAVRALWRDSKMEYKGLLKDQKSRARDRHFWDKKMKNHIIKELKKKFRLYGAGKADGKETW